MHPQLQLEIDKALLRFTTTQDNLVKQEQRNQQKIRANLAKEFSAQLITSLGLNNYKVLIKEKLKYKIRYDPIIKYKFVDARVVLDGAIVLIEKSCKNNLTLSLEEDTFRVVVKPSATVNLRSEWVTLADFKQVFFVQLAQIEDYRKQITKLYRMSYR